MRGTPTASVIALDVAGELLRVGALPAHRRLIVWLTDEPPTIDRRGRGPYSPELEPPAIEFLDLEGQFLPWSEVAWRGSFVESLHTFAGEPLANTMQAVEALASEVPGLEIHSLLLQGDDLDLLVRTHGLPRLRSLLHQRQPPQRDDHVRATTSRRSSFDLRALLPARVEA